MRITIYLFFCFFLSVINANAQSYSLGLRSGASFLRGDYGSRVAGGARTTVWDKDVFARYESKGHFAFEIGMSTFKLEAPLYDIDYGFGNDYRLVANYKKSTFYAVDLRIQYGFACSRSKRLMNYPGIIISPMQEDLAEYTEVQNIVSGTTSTTRYTDQNVGIAGGLEDLIRYSLTKHIQLNGLASYKWSTLQEQVRTCFSAQLGAAWKF